MFTNHLNPIMKVSFGLALGAALSATALAQAPEDKTKASASKTGADAAKTDAPAKPWKPRILSDGQPDIEGVWTNVFYGMGCLTNPTNGDVNCVPPPGPRPAAGTANAGGPPEVLNAAEQAAAANASGEKKPARPRRARQNAPSRILDTPDHQIPYTLEAREHQKELFSRYYAPSKIGDIDPQQRCMPLGAVRQFTWHDVKFEQYPGYIVMLFQGGMQYRIIYLDGRPHIGQELKLYFGDSRGHWEGNTLVVDTTNNNAKGRLSRAGDFSSDKVHHVERFTFLDENRFRYEATFDDPSVYTQKWTFGFDEKRGFFGGDGGVAPDGEVTAATQAKYEMWEEACHEGLRDTDNQLYGLKAKD